MSKKEIGFSDLSESFTLFLIITFSIAVGLTISGILINNDLNDIKQQLSQVPHKVCVNETTIEKTWFGCWIGDDYSLSDKQCCQMNMGKETINNGKVIGWVEDMCLVQYNKQVCKWEGLE